MINQQAKAGNKPESRIMKVKRPYHLDTETLSAFYETFDEANKQADFWIDFYCKNFGKYGNHTISVTKGKKTLRSVIILCE
jgi:hypothetical protein